MLIRKINILKSKIIVEKPEKYLVTNKQFDILLYDLLNYLIIKLLIEPFLY